MVDSGNINYAQFLQQTYQAALERNSEAQKHWQKLKDDYSTLESLLKELPKELSKDVMVPVAPKALMRGQIVHTNEILVCLGEGYFVKRSALQAVDICQRRENICTEMLQSLTKEQELLEGRKELPLRHEAFGRGAEIVEEYDDQLEAQWREEHRRKEREHRQRLAELRQKEQTAVRDEESLWKRLDELELQEELEEELDRLHASRDDLGLSDDDDDDDDEESLEDEEEEEEKEEEMLEAMQEALKKKNGIVQLETQFSISGVPTLTTVQADPAPASPSLPSSSLDTESRPRGRRVSFAGDESGAGSGAGGDGSPRSALSAVTDFGGGGDAPDAEEADLRIAFSHSAAHFQPMEETGEIPPRNPAELYLHFMATQATTSPRSILKKQSAYEGGGGDSNGWQLSPAAEAAAVAAARRGASIEREEEEEREVTLALATPLPPPVSDTIVERQPSMTDTTLGAATSRPASRFKAMRQLKKK